jgi:Glycosyl hydrolases family 16
MHGRLVIKITICVLALILAAGACSTRDNYGATARVSPARTPLARHTSVSGIWKLKWEANFSESVKLGSFSQCNNNDETPQAYCGGLPPDLRSQWWAYPNPWPDTATENHKPLGGYYDPAHTVWISAGQMHIRMFRTSGSIHSAAVVPKAGIGMMYGKYVERFKVSSGPSPGYKSAHLLWPTGAPVGDEVDFPEGPWNSTICAYVHSVYETGTRSFCTGAKFTTWHTSEIEWTPTSLKFYLDGKEIGAVAGKWVPEQPMSWIIQNESALGDQEAPSYSSAQLNIASVAIYSYQGDRS